MVKYRAEVYTKHSAYTSYPELSAEQAQAIEDSCYDRIPNAIETESGIVDIFDSYDDFIPARECYENPGKIWSYNEKSDWYTHVATGVKVKKEVVKSNNHDKWNGEGTCTITLTVKIPLPSERGKNPNSHHNKPKMPDKIIRDIGLAEGEWEQVDKLGKGKGYSQGIRNLLKAV